MYSILLLLSAITAMAFGSSLGYYQCKPCRGEECDVLPTKSCIYGTTRDACGWLQCKAGPGQQCGGREHHLGKCGDGLRCICGKCKGCSIDRLMTGIVECDTTTNVCS